MKDPSLFTRHDQSLESRIELQQGYLTPTARFFVCNSGSSPAISKQHYRLRLWGNGLDNELGLSFDDLMRLPQHKVPALIECAGNHRQFFSEVMGQQVQAPPGTSDLIWSTGAVGMAMWEGVRLADVLALAGIKHEAIQACPRGGESDSVEGEIRIPIDIDKALDKDTLLAVSMNGEPLPRDHGYPVRVLVPGWIGAYSVKWVQDIEVRCEPLWVRRNTESYVLKGDKWPAEQYVPAAGAPITCLNIKSSLALPWPTSLPSGTHTVHGYARSPGYRIASVEWSDDRGAHWNSARLDQFNEPYGWVRFEFDWFAEEGERVLMTRARDESGRVQPASIPHNTGGYLFNAIHPHPVSVVA